MKARAYTLGPAIARGIALLCAALFIAGTPLTARAAGVVGTGTAASCTDAALDGALAGGGLVTFNCGTSPVTIDISTGTGAKRIDADTTIDGGGVVTISGGNVARVFNVGTNSFTVEKLTIANGYNVFWGGGISSEGGTLTVSNSTFIGNSGGCAMTDKCWGGAISSDGTLTVSNSTFIGNSMPDVGGGGGIGFVGRLTVTNSTFTLNSAGQGGGAIANVGHTVAAITNSTFTGNSGFGITGAAVLRNTIVVNSACDGFDGFGAVIDGGHNLDDGTSCSFSAANGSLSNTDPQLDPAGLQDNGGPTQTVALCTAVGIPAGCTAASPAIDAGDESVCAAAPVNNRDQRGFVRPGIGQIQCSMGAYEAYAIAAPALCVGDCNANDSVSVDELILGVDMALGNTTLDQCEAFDCNGDGHVTVDCLVRAVGTALFGSCSFCDGCR